jgi:hypothetical protein
VENVLKVEKNQNSVRGGMAWRAFFPSPLSQRGCLSAQKWGAHIFSPSQAFKGEFLPPLPS